jgi:hypothetical protein
MFISMESLWRQLKNSKTTSDAYLLHSSIHTYKKYLNPSGGPVSLNSITNYMEGAS